MIIEIKGLPNGQKIKHINVDVTFTETSDPIVISTTQTEKKQDDSNRPSISIPSEMKDEEF
jgi:hypothetical protein